MNRWRGRLYKTDRARDFDHERDRTVRIRQIYETIDRQPYQWIVVLVAGIGFFIDGYTLFVSNIALPMIAFVYWKDKTTSLPESQINIATLCGTMLGQVLFGVLADKNGRKKMYGVELLLIIGATVGLAMSSSGVHGSMDVFAWVVWWRVLVGIGVGADYPLSAVITSEFAPTPKRARMMASVFFFQTVGQITGNVVSLLVVLGIRNSHEADSARAVDMMWRWVVGIGAIPGVIALFFRVAIPETPRFLVDIEDDPIKAEFDATELFGETQLDLERDSANHTPPMSQRGGSIVSFSNGNEESRTPNTPGTRSFSIDSRTAPADIPTLNSSWKFSKADIIQYFWHEGNWRTLLATSLCWMFLDFGYYGIGLSSPQFLAKTWSNSTLNISGPSPVWETNDNPDVSIYTMFMDTSVHALVILNIGSLVGGILFIAFADRIRRRTLQKYGFLFLAVLFIVLGVVFITREQTGPAAVVLYVIGQVAFNFGPNGTTYVIPGELFPTRYRASCHGISAGAGKLGSVLVQIFSAYYGFGGSTPGAAATKRYGEILIVFSAVMIAGAVVTHFWIPDVQSKKMKSLSLEALANGRAGLGSQTASKPRIPRSISSL